MTRCTRHSPNNSRDKLFQTHAAYLEAVSACGAIALNLFFGLPLHPAGRPSER
jgi:hypothetical protein